MGVAHADGKQYDPAREYFHSTLTADPNQSKQTHP